LITTVRQASFRNQILLTSLIIARFRHNDDTSPAHVSVLVSEIPFTTFARLRMDVVVRGECTGARCDAVGTES